MKHFDRIVLSVLSLGLLALLPAGTAGAQPVSEDRKSEESRWDSAVVGKPASLATIRDEVAAGRYFAVPRARLSEIHDQLESDRFPAAARPLGIRRARYAATLSGDSLIDGTLELDLRNATNQASFVFGRTSLRELTFQSGGDRVPVAATADGKLTFLAAPGLADVSGTWSAEGARQGDVVRFGLQLPPSVLTELKLVTEPSVQVTCQNAIVTHVDQESSREWTVYPWDNALVDVVCTQSTRTVAASASVTLSPRSILRVNESNVFVAWDFLIPPSLHLADISLNLPAHCQVQDVTDDLLTRLNWRQQDDDSGRRLTIRSVSAGRTVTVEGVSESAADGRLHLPFISAGVWNRLAQAGGLIQLRPSSCQLRIPPALAVSDLELAGIYQQDVKFNLDGAQVIEFEQYASAPAVSVRLIPVSVPVRVRSVIDRGGASAESAATVYVDIEPQSGEVFEVDWTIGTAWRPTGVQEFQSGRPVDYEIRASEDQNRDRMRVNLPAPATRDQPARLAIQFRSTRTGAPRLQSFPRLRNEEHLDGTSWLLPVRDGSPRVDVESDRRPVMLGDEFPWLVGTIDLSRHVLVPVTDADLSAGSTAQRSAVDPSEKSGDGNLAHQSPADPESLRVVESPDSSEAADADDMTHEDSQSKDWIAVRGLVRRQVSWARGRLACRSLACIDATWTGSPSAISTRLPSDGDFQVFVDGHEVRCPVNENGDVLILLPQDTNTALVQLLWDCHLSARGWPHPELSLDPPAFISADVADLVQQIRLPIGLVPAPEAMEAMNEGSVNTQALPVADFMAAWRLAEASGIWNVPIGRDVLPLRHERTHIAGFLLGLLLSAWAARFLFRIGSGAVFVALATGLLCNALVNAVWQSPFHGWNLGLATAIIVVMAVRLVRAAWREVVSTESPGSMRQYAISATLLLALPICPAATAQESAPVLVPDTSPQDSDIVYVRSDLLATAAGLTHNINPHDVRVDDVAALVTLEADDSLEITVTARVAARAGSSPSRFRIPQGEATLTQARIDDARVLPMRSADGGAEIELPSNGDRRARDILSPDRDDLGDADEKVVAAADVEDAVEDGEEESPQVPGPGAFEQWNLHVVEYRLRSEAIPAGAELRLDLPLPESVRAIIRVQAENRMIRRAQVVEVPRAEARADAAGFLEFPVLFNRGAVSLRIEAGSVDHSEEEPACAARVACVVETASAGAQLTTHYSLRSDRALPLQIVLTDVRGFHPVSIRNGEGDTLEWTVDDGRIIVEPGFSDSTRLRVTWQPDTASRTLLWTIPDAALRVPENCTTERVVLAVSVSSRFYVAGVSAEDRDISELLLSELSDPEWTEMGLRPSDQLFNIAPGASDVELRLEQRETTRSVRLSQTVVAAADQIDWICQCDMTVRGSRIFRQQIEVDPELRIDLAAVTVAGADRLHSWTMQAGRLLLTLREPTRGSVRITLHGRRSVGDDRRLEIRPPEFRGCDVSESEVFLSAEKAAVVFLEIKGDDVDAVPTEPALSDDPLAQPAGPQIRLSETAHRLSLLDSSGPVLIWGEDSAPAIRVFAVIDSDEENPTADVVLSFQARRPWTATFEHRAADGSNPAWVCGGERSTLNADDGVYSVPGLNSGESGTLIIRDLPVEIREGRRDVAIPLLDVRPELESVNVVDLFGHSEEPIKIPDWARLALELPAEALDPDWQQREARFDADRFTLQIDVPVNSAAEPDDRVSDEPAHSLSVTRLEIQAGRLTGRTQLLIETGTADKAVCRLPDDIRLTECRVDDRAVLLKPEAGVLDVPGGPGIRRVVLRWHRAWSPAGMLLSAREIALPAVDGPDAHGYVVLEPVGSSSSVVMTGRSSLSVEEFRSELSSVASAFASARSDSPEVWPFTSPLMQEFTSTALPEQRSADVRIVVPNNAGRIVIQVRRSLSPVAWLPWLALGGLGLTLLVESGRRKRRQAAMPDVAA